MTTPTTLNVMKYAIAEKKNHLAIHGIFNSRDSAERFLKETTPEYVAKSYYTDKTLTADSFEVIEYNMKGKKIMTTPTEKRKPGRPKGNWGDTVRISVPTGILSEILEIIRKFKWGVKS